MGGRPSGAGPGAGSSHLSANRAFPGAPQPNGYGVESHACALAAPNRYLPARSGCVSVRRADLDGDGRPDLVLAYSHLSRRHVSGYVGGTPPALRGDFVPDAAFLKVVLASGGTVTTRLRWSTAPGRSTAPVGYPKVTVAAIDRIARVNGGPGGEVFIEVERVSSGGAAVAYGLRHGRLVPAGVTLAFGGDSAYDAGFECVPGSPPRLIQRTFKLIGPTIFGWWRETKVVYAWHGLKLAQISKRTLRRRGRVTARDAGTDCGLFR